MRKPPRQRQWTADEMRRFEVIAFNRDVARHSRKLLLYDRDDPAYARNFVIVYVKELQRAFRLNGNTRSYLDSTNEKELPEIVYGDEYTVDTWAEALALYNKIDNPNDVKGAIDRMHTALSYNRIIPRSKYFSTWKDR